MFYRVAFNDPKYSYNEDVRFVKVAVGAAKVKGTTLEKDEGNVYPARRDSFLIPGLEQRAQ